MTDWDSYYMRKPTDLSALYPCTQEVRRALEDRAMERRVTWIARGSTALIFGTLAAITYIMYPELVWLIARY